MLMHRQRGIGAFIKSPCPCALIQRMQWRPARLAMVRDSESVLRQPQLVTRFMLLPSFNLRFEPGVCEEKHDWVRCASGRRPGHCWQIHCWRIWFVFTNIMFGWTAPLDRRWYPSLPPSGWLYRFPTCLAGNATELRSPQRDACSWTALISQHTKSGQAREALKIYDELRQGGVRRSSYIFVAILKACRSLQDLESGRQIHAEVVENGFESDVYVGTMLVDMYSKCGSLVDSRRVFDKMPRRNVVSWNAMILGYAQLEQGEEALQLYRQMQIAGVEPDNRTFVGALKACSSLSGLEQWSEGHDGSRLKNRSLEQARAVHLDIVRRGSAVADVYVWNILLDVYAKCGSLVEATLVFENMPHRTVVSWNAIIMGYSQMEDGQGALHLYARMQKEDVVPDDRTYVGALKGCSILADGNNQSLEQVRDIHRRIVKGGFESDIFVGTMLVDVYSKCGSLVDARLIFEKMRRRDVVSWTAMIWGYAQMEEGEEALQLYARMQQEGITPNYRTLFGALKACGCVAGLDRGKEIHTQIVNLGLKATDLVLSRGLIDMYSKCGSMVDAQQVFDGLPTRDVGIWSALIAGYARLGETELVLDLFEGMLQEGVLPNGITFLSVLTSCSHAGLVGKGQDYFEAMSRDYGLAPTIDHYTCVVDLLGRSGQLDKAMAMVEGMPFKPDGVVWRTVLGACRKWSNVDLGRQAFECAVRVDSSDAASYVLMSSIYAAADMLEAAEDIRSMRVNSHTWKQPGLTRWTDSTGMVHAFVVGDREHHKSQHIYAQLRDLSATLKQEGHVPHLDSPLLLDVPDGQNDLASRGHGEKLEAAYALLVSPTCTTTLPLGNNLPSGL